MNKNSYRILKLSLKEAREYYYGDNDTKKELALMLFSENELTNIDFDDILCSINERTRDYCNDQAADFRKILAVAKYFNKLWEKTYDNDGYFWDYDPEYGWHIKMHKSVKYPGIVYYKNEYFAKMAFDLCKKEYDNIR